MKKGLHVTLMTVAIAAMALQAMAMAPVISQIPDPVVGNEIAITGGAYLVTSPTPFYYPDAFDLNAYVADGDTADGDILWSYSYSGTEIYRINNVAPLVIGTDDINAPGAKRLNGTPRTRMMGTVCPTPSPSATSSTRRSAAAGRLRRLPV